MRFAVWGSLNSRCPPFAAQYSKGIVIKSLSVTSAPRSEYGCRCKEKVAYLPASTSGIGDSALRISRTSLPAYAFDNRLAEFPSPIQQPLLSTQADVCKLVRGQPAPGNRVC